MLKQSSYNLPTIFQGIQCVHLYYTILKCTLVDPTVRSKPLSKPLSRASRWLHAEGYCGEAGFYRLLKSWGMDPGLEFKVAMEEAERLRATLVYGDADQDHTIRRISQSLSAQVRSTQKRLPACDFM